MTATQELDVRPAPAPRPWLPTAPQLRDAAQLRVEDAIGPDPISPDTPRTSITTTMQQSMGLVIAAALAAGLLSTLVDWLRAARAGTAIPLLELATQSTGGALATLPAPLQPVGETLQTIAGLDPVMPGWLAALLSALAEWINWPLTWLSYWLVFGIIVLLAAKLFGAPTTLQRFYAGTGYAAVPLMLVGLGFIPWVGWLVALIGVALALFVYWRGVRVVTGLGGGESAFCVAAPLVIAFVLGMALVGATMASVVRMMFL
jgi:hypothetical protein